MKNKFNLVLAVKRLMMLLASVTALHLPYVYAKEAGTPIQSKSVLANLINEMLICERFKDISQAKTVRTDIRKIKGFKELPSMSLTDEAGNSIGKRNIYAVNETYAGLSVAEIRQTIMPKHKEVKLWIAFEASMPRVKEVLKSQLGIEFKDDEGSDAMPNTQAGDIFAFHEGTDVTLELDFFTAKPGKIYMSCRRKPQLRAIGDAANDEVFETRRVA